MTRPPGGDVPGVEAPGPSPSRRLLAQIRDIMAGADPPQQRLDRIVRLIAAEMVAEVCSCYVRRPGDVLELFATVGLNPGAVHQTRLRIGEGLVGEIAATGRPLALADARGHPRFAYRPETGEDPFQSLDDIETRQTSGTPTSERDGSERSPEGDSRDQGLDLSGGTLPAPA